MKKRKNINLSWFRGPFPYAKNDVKIWHIKYKVFLKNVFEKNIGMNKDKVGYIELYL